ncbi:Uncharacterised protein [Bordetella pertussis]|nr:Uncharacterised protein [Bordetella pertussis]
MRRSIAVGWWRARIRLMRSSISTSCRLTSFSRSRTFSTMLMSPAGMASTASWIMASTIPPIWRNCDRTCCRSASNCLLVCSVIRTPCVVGLICSAPENAVAQRAARPARL